MTAVAVGALRRDGRMRRPARGDPEKPWTADFLAFVLPLTPDQVLSPASDHGGVTPASAREWAWIDLAQRLTWLYGPAEALARLNALPGAWGNVAWGNLA